MTERIPHDERTIRAFILYDALAKRDPFEAYKTFCKAIDDENFNYVDYEAQYYRFLHGNLDLSYDQRLNPVHPKLMDLPNEILVKVVEKLDVKSRLATQKVSRKLRQIRTRNPAEIREFEIRNFTDGIIQIKIEGTLVSYQKNPDDEDYCTVESENVSTTIPENFLNLALADLSRILAPVNTRIDTFSFNLQSSNVLVALKLLEHLQSIGHLLHARLAWLIINDESIALEFLKLFKPKVLETFWFDEDKPFQGFNQLMETEQFRMADGLNMKEMGVFRVSDFDKFLHFEFFQLTIQSINTAGILTIRDWLKGSAHFESCVMDVVEEMDLTGIAGAFGDGLYSIIGSVCGTFSIPGSDEEVLKFLIPHPQLIIIRKVEKGCVLFI